MNYRNSKYGAKKTPRTLRGGKQYTFSSKHEAERYDQLMVAKRAGLIRNLILQPEFTLVEGFRDIDTGEHIKPIKYIADFRYEQPGDGGVWETVVEDAKGVRTDVYSLKVKMMLAQKGIRVVEV